jgi:hypothetical protein
MKSVDAVVSKEERHVTIHQPFEPKSEPVVSAAPARTQASGCATKREIFMIYVSSLKIVDPQFSLWVREIFVVQIAGQKIDCWISFASIVNHQNDREICGSGM